MEIQILKMAVHVDHAAQPPPGDPTLADLYALQHFAVQWIPRAGHAAHMQDAHIPTAAAQSMGGGHLGAGCHCHNSAGLLHSPRARSKSTQRKMVGQAGQIV